MEVIIKPDAEEADKEAARIFGRLLIEKPQCVLGLATGSTPLGLYRELVSLYEKGVLDFSAVTTFNLDEYVGLHRDHPQSYFHFMWENFFSKVNISRENIHIPDGLVENIPDHCWEY